MPLNPTNQQMDPDPPAWINSEQWAQAPEEIRQRWASMSPEQRRRVNERKQAEIRQDTVPGLSRGAYQRSINEGATQQLRGMQPGQQTTGPDPEEARKRTEAMLQKTAPSLTDPMGTFQKMMKTAGDSVPQVDWTQDDEIQGIELNLSQINDAIDEFAKAKVQAAKQGARTGRVTARNANMQMMLNALGPGVMQAITGARQPSFQPGNNQRAAQSALGRYQQQVQRAEETQATAGAQADVQKAEQDLNKQKTEQESQMQADQFNTRLEKQIEQGNQAQQIDLGLALTKLSQRSQQAVMQMMTENMKAMQSEQEGREKIPGTVLRVEGAWTVGNQHEQEAQNLNQIFQEVNSMPARAFGSFNQGDMEKYAAEKIASDDPSMSADDVLTQAQENEGVARELERIRQEGERRYNLLTETLVGKAAYTPEQGLTKALGLDGQAGLAKQVRETIKEHENFARDLKRQAINGISTEDSYTPQVYYNILSLLQDGGPAQERTSTTDNVEEDTASSSGVSIQGDPLNY